MCACVVCGGGVCLCVCCVCVVHVCCVCVRVYTAYRNSGNFRVINFCARVFSWSVATTKIFQQRKFFA